MDGVWSTVVSKCMKVLDFLRYTISYTYLESFHIQPMFCFVLVSGEPQAAELMVSTKLHLPQSLVTHLNSIISIII